jgi:14-3-3 protein epsilon
MVEKNLTREEYIILAKLYENTEKFPLMVESIIAFVALNPVLSQEERALLNTGFKNIIAKQRIAWRELATRERQEEKNKKVFEYILELRREVEQEILNNSDKVLAVLDKYLIANSNSNETKAYYLKMKADFLRYKAEVTVDSEYEKNHKLSEAAYAEGYKLAETLPISNPIRLGLALNYSVLHYEVKLNKEEAMKIAKQAYDEAMKIIDDLDKNKSKDTILIIQLLKENLGLWNNDNEEETEI